MHLLPTFGNNRSNERQTVLTPTTSTSSSSSSSIFMNGKDNNNIVLPSNISDEITPVNLIPNEPATTSRIKKISTFMDISSDNNNNTQRSLSYLCTRFCEEYKDCRENFSIEEVSVKLDVQRRRIYEILNIMKSVGLISRIKTGIYKWEGYEPMVAHLSELQRIGGGAGKKKKVTTGSSESKKSISTCISEHFIQLFICNQYPQPIYLEKVLSIFGESSNPVSRGRRLYDIGNVLCTLGLITRGTGIDPVTRKKIRHYTWCGPTLALPCTAAMRASVPPPPPVVRTVPVVPVVPVVPQPPTKKKSAKSSSTKKKKRKSQSSSVSSSCGRKKTRVLTVRKISPKVMSLMDTLSPKVSSPFPSNNSYVAPPPLTSRLPQNTVFLRREDSSIWGEEENSILLGTSPINVLNKGDSVVVSEAARLRAEVKRLALALEKSAEREHSLLDRLESQKNQISRLQQAVNNTPRSSTSTSTPSEDTSLLFTPSSLYRKSCNSSSIRGGPSLPILLEDSECSNTPTTTSFNVVPSTPNSLFAAASSLLSLTPQTTSTTMTPRSRGCNLDFPILKEDEALTYKSTPVPTMVSSSSSYHSIFNGLSPLV